MKQSDDVMRALAEDIAYLRGTATELVAHLRSQVVNGVLEVATLAVDAGGSLTRSYSTPVGSIVIINATNTGVVAASGGPTGTVAPTTGRGSLPVPANSWLPMPIDAHSFTVYGTPGQVIGFVAFTGMQAFGFVR